MVDSPYLPPAHERRAAPQPEFLSQSPLDRGVDITLKTFALGLGYGIVKLHWDPAFRAGEPYVKFVGKYGGRFGMFNVSTQESMMSGSAHVAITDLTRD